MKTELLQQHQHLLHLFPLQLPLVSASSRVSGRGGGGGDTARGSVEKIRVRGPAIVAGMELTEVVDEVGPYFIRHCCRKPKMEWFAASNEAAMSVTGD